MIGYTRTYNNCLGAVTFSQYNDLSDFTYSLRFSNTPKFASKNERYLNRKK